MKSKIFAQGKSKAQAMVEFAIALPILLMLLYGILEAGRLLFLYSTVVTASRQAVRYGSATGVGGDYTSEGGPNNSGYPRYQDCYGIRRIANRSDFLNAFDHTGSDVVITYDNGPGTATSDTCDGNADPGVSPSSLNTTRIVVTIQGDFFPIVPRLVPFIERSVANGNPILGESARTIIVAISIVVTEPPTAIPPSSPTPSNTPTATATNTPTNTPTFTPSPTLQYTYTPSQTPTKTLTPTITPTFTKTPSPTVTLTPTSIPTGVTGCNSITHGSISFSGNTMNLTINSPVPVSVQLQDVFVVWNHDKGHSAGNKKLVLQSVSLGSQIWSGSSNGPSISITPSPTAYLPSGSSTITFTFDQSYDTPDNTEEILINLASPGCTSFPIHATYP